VKANSEGRYQFIEFWGLVRHYRQHPHDMDMVKRTIRDIRHINQEDLRLKVQGKWILNYLRQECGQPIHQLDKCHTTRLPHIQVTSTVTSHIGRNSNCLFVPRVRTSYGKNSFYYNGTLIWNSLNAAIYTVTSLTQLNYINLFLVKMIMLIIVSCMYVILLHAM